MIHPSLTHKASHNCKCPALAVFTLERAWASHTTAEVKKDKPYLPASVGAWQPCLDDLTASFYFHPGHRCSFVIGLVSDFSECPSFSLSLSPLSLHFTSVPSGLQSSSLSLQLLDKPCYHQLNCCPSCLHLTQSLILVAISTQYCFCNPTFCGCQCHEKGR